MQNPVQFGGDFSEQQYREFALKTTVTLPTPSSGKLIRFTLMTKEKLDSGDTYEIQKKVGYHPSAYSHIFANSYFKEDSQEYMTLWWCNALEN